MFLFFNAELFKGVLEGPELGCPQKSSWGSCRNLPSLEAGLPPGDSVCTEIVHSILVEDSQSSLLLRATVSVKILVHIFLSIKCLYSKCIRAHLEVEEKNMRKKSGFVPPTKDNRG